jgi:PKHD-type hydroxylase|tara:strand:- start:1175 stop:1771 length:597 start_codon:yes stop_codon:yes gene_type:complete
MAHANSPTEKKAPYIRIQSKWFKNNCKKIIDEFDESCTRGTTIGGNINDKRKSDVFLYDIWKLDLPDFQKVVIYKIKEIFTTENKRYHYDLDYSSINIQFTRYKVDEFYEWHTDDAFIFTHKKHNNVRKLSVMCPLNAGEYEGGELQLKLDYQEEPRNINIEPGDIIVFPSFTLHRILPITSNIRYSLVAWISGPPWR